ncbi:ribosome biogenesis GTPase [Thermodesulfitimonas autotrophica]|uniref:Small ribosomal subunit biogenesis GTPase RsgA n=1 Tax=Thermodesulfitimonas autotrophica TaxID=1894989 RepID=A0A3N5AVR0_9THEO|nr:ribosome small subunit-dependent GTPase A [Thermodesulfitimonas autotrophica]RPF49306.1 ribosome biogenesis GTPase [Thermodesulfitimonas autotrophica]
MVAEGRVIKFYGGFCYVMVDGAVKECLPRRRLVTAGLLVGDRVKVGAAEAGRCVVEAVLPRRTVLFRPPVANVELAVLVFSIRDPQPNFGLLDRLLVVSQAAGIEALVCFNKLDLARDTPPAEVAVYRAVGYRVILTSALSGEGVTALRDALADRISVFAGPSGAGKSSLLNAIQPGLRLRTGEISHKTRRGRHTTRVVELLPLTGGGLVADTPGFTQLDLPDIPAAELAAYFPEIAAASAGCRFNDCLHVQEPACAVRRAVEEGTVALFRYRNYLSFLRELKEKERRF